jgi:hypothetical protein
LTFTTSSVPIISHCFDLEELFGGNATQGFVNQTGNIRPPYTGEAGIHWQLENVDTYDPQTNFSSILYRQHVTDPAPDKLKPGNQADRAVNVYPSKTCTELGPGDELLSWYGFSCWSENEGSCGTTPYRIGSFAIVNLEKTSDNGKCWVFAELGAAGRGYSPSQAMMGAFLSTLLAIWLV